MCSAPLEEGRGGFTVFLNHTLEVNFVKSHQMCHVTVAELNRSKSQRTINLRSPSPGPVWLTTASPTQPFWQPNAESRRPPAIPNTSSHSTLHGGRANTSIKHIHAGTFCSANVLTQTALKHHFFAFGSYVILMLMISYFHPLYIVLSHYCQKTFLFSLSIAFYISVVLFCYFSFCSDMVAVVLSTLQCAFVNELWGDLTLTFSYMINGTVFWVKIWE